MVMISAEKQTNDNTSLPDMLALFASLNLIKEVEVWLLGWDGVQG